MTNFCHPVMKPAIDCSTISTDGFEITNLISEDCNLRRKGFIAYHAIRPPVTITLNFLCKVNVSDIILWSEVGSQRSTGFELYAASKCNSGTPCVCKKICSSNYEKIAYAIINGSEKGIVFSRNQNASSHTNCSDLVKSNFFSSKRALLCNVSSLQIKIIKTASSVPCLARIEVLGQPSRSSNESTRKHIAALWDERHKKTTKSDTNTDLGESDKVNPVVEVDEFLKIPEEFIDPITFMLMALPMTLPCGKVVDQSTLDKFEQYEATWGRAPSDPFTGKIFSDACRPILTTSLKARIDKFLIENAHLSEVKNAPRTTGRKLSATAASSKSSHEYKSIAGSIMTEKNEKEYKRPYDIFSEDCNTNKKLCKEENLTFQHEERLAKSLHLSVRSVLADLPSFTKFENAEITQPECTNCHLKHLLYKLPCEHFVCRTCLTKKQASCSMNCDACKVAFHSGDPIRYYN